MPPSRAKTIATWIISALLALLFLFAGGSKLWGQEEVVKGFESFGFPQWFRLFIGAAEVAGGIGLVVPALAQFAAAGLMIIMAGAVWTVISVGQPVVFPLVVLVLLGVVIWLRRGT
jgi:uncharacterized membrane protein YphA (DoxX/SURF4 family)